MEVFGEDGRRRRYECRECGHEEMKKESFFMHLYKEKKCRQYYEDADKDGYRCKYGCGGRGRNLETMIKHESFLRSRTKGHAGKEYYIDEIDRRRPGRLWTPMKTQVWENLGLIYRKEEGKWECLECGRCMPTSAGRNMLIHARSKHGRGSKIWERMEENTGKKQE